MEIKVWILSGVIVALSGILWWLVRLGIKGIYARLDKMIEQNDETSKSLIKQDGKIVQLENRMATADKRLDDHAGRIRTLEIKSR